MKTKAQLHKEYEKHSREVTRRGHVLISLMADNRINDQELAAKAYCKLMKMTKRELIKTLASTVDLTILGCSFNSEARANKE